MKRNQNVCLKFSCKLIDQTVVSFDSNIKLNTCKPTNSKQNFYATTKTLHSFNTFCSNDCEVIY